MIESLVVNHIGNAKKIAHDFARRFPFPDMSEAESVALLALVKAAARFRGTAEDGGMFWNFVRPAVAGALVDELRLRFGRRNRRRFVRLRESMAVHLPIAAIDGRLTIERASVVAHLTRREREVLASELADEGIDSRVNGHSAHKANAIKKLREALRGAD